MRQAVVIDALRTPIGKASSDKGIYRDVRAEELSAHVIDALMKRTGIDPHLVDDVRWGCVQQQGEQGFDVARTIALMAGLPIEAGGVTINRNCASSLQAVNDAAMNIAANCEDVQIAGGVEHMDHVPMNKDYNPPPGLFFKHSEAIMNMGLTAEYMAQKYQVPRQKQDEFSYRSHRLAAEATKSGAFKSEIAPTWGRDDAGRKVQISQDQGIRYDCTVEGLSQLPAAFNPAGGSVTAGSCARGTGAGGAALSRLNGILTNAVNMTMTYGPSGTTSLISANKATYVGSMFMDTTNGQVSCYVSWGQNRKFGLWNAYNRAPITLQGGDSTASWSYTTATIREANGSTANTIVIFSGLAEEPYTLSYTDQVQIAASNAQGGMKIGIGFNGTTAFTGQVAEFAYSSGIATTVNLVGSITANYPAPPSLGINNVNALEDALAPDGATMLGTTASMLLLGMWRG